MSTVSVLASVSLLLSAVATFAAAPRVDAPTMDLAVPEVLRLPTTRALVYTPVKLKEGDSISFTALQTAEVNKRQANGTRGIQIMIFAADPAGTGYTIKLEDILISSFKGALGSGGTELGTGKVSMQDFHFASVPEQHRFADGSVRLLIAVVGFEQNGTATPPKPAPLPGELSLTTQIDQDGVALLLPAVQAAREAARRSR
ncbi:MAG: hypothetical protein EOP84_21155 [Verrucomicrobiaceae bacterium]|nr:MAG: hypothetical protein EOP84_21155 [Verrucomicrobiaceae bacterium]